MYLEKIGDKKLRHMRSVAEQCVRLGFELGLDDDTLEELYVLGFLHDIGYAFGAKGHAKKGEAILTRLGLKGAQHIGAHESDAQDATEIGAIGIEDIIKYGDMTVNAEGEKVSFDERLEDIRNRYGDDSHQYKTSIRIVQKLREKFNQIRPEEVA